MTPDPKPAPRVRVNREGWRDFRSELPAVCQLCGSTGYALGRTDDPKWSRSLYIGLSIHHLVPKSQGGDDVKDNLAVLCGDGTRGCHGDVEARRNDARSRLREKLTDRQIAYIYGMRGWTWLDRHYPVAL